MDVICAVCRLRPAEIAEYVELAKDCDYATAEEAVRQEEGTFNVENGLFTCTSCYVDIGMPTGPDGWRPGGLIARPRR